jgi:hypothetical protein
MEAAAGNERDLDAACGRVCERVTMRVRELAATVEERPVYVDREEADH